MGVFISEQVKGERRKTTRHVKMRLPLPPFKLHSGQTTLQSIQLLFDTLLEEKSTVASLWCDSELELQMFTQHTPDPFIHHSEHSVDEFIEKLKQETEEAPYSRRG